MKKKFQRIRAKVLITFLLVSLCVVVVFFLLLNHLNQDNTPPNISFESESIQLTEAEVSEVLEKDYSCLLTGVSAFDEEDGDITNRIIVYSVNLYDNDSYAVINYRVLDRSNNMATGQRIAYLKSPEEIYNNFLSTAANEVADIFNGSEADISYEEDSERPVITMESAANLAIGDSFDPLDYLIALEDDNDSFETLLQNWRVEGVLDLNSPGVYPLAFYVTDSDGNESDAAVLIVTVSLNEVG